MHGDVFRPPGRAMLLAAAVGTGTQLCLLAVAVILLTIMGTFYEVRSTVQCSQSAGLCLPCDVLHSAVYMCHVLHV